MLPRASEFTGRQSAAELRAERENAAARARYLNAARHYGYGTPHGLAMWRRITEDNRTR